MIRLPNYMSEFEPSPIKAMDTLHHESADKKKKYWVKGRELISSIEQQKSFQQRIDAIFDDDREKFLLSDAAEKTSCCIDEGVEDHGEYHSAGSDVLRVAETAKLLIEQGMDKKDVFQAAFNQAVAEVAERFEKLGLKKITAHEGCGAAAKCVGDLKKLLGEDFNYGGSSDEFGKLFVDAVVEKMGNGAVAEYITDLKRPSEFHSAQACYYDLTGRAKIDFDQLKELPQGFVVTRVRRDDFNDSAEGETAMMNAELAWQIAAGAHGLGDSFTLDNPFIFYIIAPSEVALLQARIELETIAARVAGRVKIDGCVVPANEK